MKYLRLAAVFFLLAPALQAQKAVVKDFSAIDTKVAKLPDSLTRTTADISRFISENFKTSEERVRAVFIWIATNIQYDIDNMYAINFYEAEEDKITKPLQSRKGICENYAALFTDICSKSGIKSYVIEGYTKQNGFADYIPHAWCAALIDSSWYMFDPTWGSGYVNGGKFYRKINNDYYHASPAMLIRSHMPFDYLWQFLHYPVTNQEFYESKTIENKSKPYFNYKDSIDVYEKLDHTDQLISTANRIQKNGVKNSMIFDRLRHIQSELESDRQTRMIHLYNASVAGYNEGINAFNLFIQYRNNQFTPLKPDPEIQKMIDTAGSTLKDAKIKLSRIVNPDANTLALISKLNQSIDELLIHVKEQQDWLTLYFSKSKSKRKAMFYEQKLTWFGIPVN